MRIEGLELKNIGVFKDAKMEFPKCPDGQAEIHIFTGVNGSGKSTILKALACGFEEAEDETLLFESLDINNFSKYCSLNISSKYNTEKQKEVAELRSAEGKIILDKKNTIDFFKWKGKFGVKTDSRNIENYRNLTGIDGELSFALFAYSGYRSVENIQHLYTIKSESKLGIDSPLYQALKFIKDPNHSHSLEEWVKKSLYKRAYARDNHLDKKETAYNDTIDKLEKAISEIVGFDIRFALDVTLEHPIIKYANKTLSFDVLPDGLKSLISWLADLCIRLDKIKWTDDTPVFDRNLILFLDEIENHLHIKWQRRVLPIVQKLLPNAQVFVTTHSPFVVNSIDEAWVHRLQLDEATKTATIAAPQRTSTGNSYITELMKTFEVYEEYGIPVSEKLQEFHKMKKHIEEGKNGNTTKFLTLAKDLASVSQSLNNDIQIQLRKLSKQTSKKFSIHD